MLKLLGTFKSFRGLFAAQLAELRLFSIFGGRPMSPTCAFFVKS